LMRLELVGDMVAPDEQAPRPSDTAAGGQGQKPSANS
jgi:hypothetical protein